MNNEERLREYVNTDLSYQDFKKGKGVFSDFDMFCIEHCKDIEELLEKVKQLEDDLYAANQCINELLDVQEKYDRLLKIAKKMHLWIFLHSGDEQKVYDELGLTDKENEMLGYSGKIVLGDIDDNS